MNGGYATQGLQFFYRLGMEDASSSPAAEPKTPADWLLLAAGTGLFLGCIPPKVATLPTVLGIPLAIGIHAVVGWQGYLVACALLVALAVWICGRSAQLLGSKDPREVAFDEIATLPIVYFLAPSWSWQILLGGFVLHRLFDIVKPFGIRRLERLGGGLGIVADDFVAAWLAFACMQGLISCSLVA